MEGAMSVLYRVIFFNAVAPAIVNYSTFHNKVNPYFEFSGLFQTADCRFYSVPQVLLSYKRVQ